MVKNPNKSEANQLAIYNNSRRFDLETTEKQIQIVIRVEVIGVA